jgi:hypothetical protein
MSVADRLDRNPSKRAADKSGQRHENKLAPVNRVVHCGQALSGFGVSGIAVSRFAQALGRNLARRLSQNAALISIITIITRLAEAANVRRIPTNTISPTAVIRARVAPFGANDA